MKFDSQSSNRDLAPTGEKSGNCHQLTVFERVILPHSQTVLKYFYDLNYFGNKAHEYLVLLLVIISRIIFVIFEINLL